MKSRDSSTKETRTGDGRTCHVNQRDYSFRTENRQSVYPAGCNASCRFYILENKKYNVHPLYVHAFCLRVTRMREPTLVPFLPGTCSAKNYYLHFSFRRSLLLFYQFPRISQPPLLYNLISLTNKPSIQCITLFFG